MNVSWSTVVAMVVVCGSAVQAQSYPFLAREACAIHEAAETLSDLIHRDLHDSPFERRLLNDAAELHRVAARLEDAADRRLPLPHLQAQARVLAIVVQRLDRGVHEAENFAIRQRHGGSCRVSTRAVESFVHRLSLDIANLQRDLDSLCRLDSAPRTPVQPWQQPRDFSEREVYPWNGQRVPAAPSGTALSFGNGRFTIQFGR
jgi:hypothetical protein